MTKRKSRNNGAYANTIENNVVVCCYLKERRKIPETNAKMKAAHRKYSWKPNVKKHKIEYQQIIRNDRRHAREIEKTENAFAIFAKTAESPSLIENIKLHVKQEEELRRARINARRRVWRARRKALGLPAI